MPWSPNYIWPERGNFSDKKARIFILREFSRNSGEILMDSGGLFGMLFGGISGEVFFLPGD